MSRDNQQERWQTPPEVFDPLMREFDFDLDAAADKVTHRVFRFMGGELCDSLTLPWPGDRVWLNPPYGRKLEPFVRRAADEHYKFPHKTIVALIPFRCRAAWWHDCVIGVAKEVRCIRKRVRFMRLEGTRGQYTGSCDSCLVIWQGKVSETILRGWMPQSQEDSAG